MTVANWARRLNSRHGSGLPPLILIVDRKRLADPLTAAAHLPAGSAVLLRDYDAPDRAHLAKALARLCRRQRLTLLIGDDARLAASLGAGVHLPQGLVARARRQRDMVTAAAHDRAALVRAARAGATACLISPVFATASHPGAHALGPVRFANLVRQARLPVYALGGISDRTATRLWGSGACGIAALGALADRPETTQGAAWVDGCQSTHPAGRASKKG
ncbi:MAG: thiamine phosphate synthase [Alphaproteobacteria bacterium]|jgi:thiamine-phosphate pyrophosphorylase|nr:thiamine phosphate synthase [Alphaproteobacteria bacterium]MDP6238457.1 thiamine phosphate synthase [Alphaproteobacteria bacterium]MDP7172584.1 thiamine phosphate synthase [Alphaproteobacteria bacterium]MDP7234256.1 thiamine phosphate synthase [Alphaproteobacteria bacterium]MDP7487874.1 thiamine phosphate synthase [Alphaproteobacteria bacterium]|tara:strand:- start:561 stop:1217 length:657 start_codon:yes stop_codon:yes gene_type:complete